MFFQKKTLFEYCLSSHSAAVSDLKLLGLARGCCTSCFNLASRARTVCSGCHLRSVAEQALSCAAVLGSVNLVLCTFYHFLRFS